MTQMTLKESYEKKKKVKFRLKIHISFSWYLHGHFCIELNQPFFSKMAISKYYEILRNYNKNHNLSQKFWKSPNCEAYNV